MKNTTDKFALNEIVAAADGVALRHGEYVNNFITRANEELYEILADILRIYEQVIEHRYKDKLIKQLKVKLKNIHGLKVQSNTKLTTLLTKYVTRASRKTAHVYSAVLEIAISNGVTSNNLIEFIKLKGGINRVRMKVRDEEERRVLKSQINNYQLNLKKQLERRNAICSVDLSSIKDLPVSCDVDFHHLLCKFNHQTNKHEVVAVMYPSSALEKQAMHEYLIMLDVAFRSDANDFYKLCKERGLNMDILHRWMSANKLDGADSAKSLVASLKQASDTS